MTESYEDINPDVADAVRTRLRAEARWSREHDSSSIILPTLAADALVALLRDLHAVAWQAPGGHGYLCDEALRWGEALAAGRSFKE